MIGKSAEQTKKLKEKTAELAGQYIETGDEGAAAFERVDAQLKAMATSTDGSMKSLVDIRKEAEKAGLPFRTLAQAYAGNTEALEESIAAQEKKIQTDGEEIRSALGTGRGAAIASNTKRQATQSQIDSLTEQKKILADAKQAELDYIQSGGPEMEAKAARIKTVNAAYDETAGAVDKYLDKEKNFDPKKYLANMHAREKALAGYQDALATVNLSPEAKEFIDSQGLDAASAFLTGYKKASPRQKEELNRIWTEAGKDNSGEYLSAAQKAIDAKTVRAPEIAIPRLDVTKFLRATQADLDKKPALKITVDVVDRNGKKVYEP